MRLLAADVLKLQPDREWGFVEPLLAGAVVEDLPRRTRWWTKQLADLIG
jgi:hypothetical protein